YQSGTLAGYPSSDRYDRLATSACDRNVSSSLGSIGAEPAQAPWPSIPATDFSAARASSPAAPLRRSDGPTIASNARSSIGAASSHTPGSSGPSTMPSLLLDTHPLAGSRSPSVGT